MLICFFHFCCYRNDVAYLDLFAFVIKMPTMHRLSCFRDDIIFFIYIYQWWMYPVDHSRANEFGQGGEDEDAIDESSSVVESLEHPESLAAVESSPVEGISSLQQHDKLVPSSDVNDGRAAGAHEKMD